MTVWASFGGKLLSSYAMSAQGRNEVRWRPRQEASLAPPCSNL